MKFANNSANTNGTGAALIAYDGPCVFFSLHVSTGASGGYVMLFDSRSAPGKGDRPKRVWDVDEAQSFDHETANGIPMQNGCVIALSSTQFTFTSFVVEVLIDAVFYIPPPPAPPKTDPLPEDPALKPSPAPQRPPPASTPAGRPAPTSKPLKGTVAALLVGFLTLCSSGWAATSTTPGSSGGGHRVAAGTNITAQTNGIVVTINANSSASGGSSNLLWARTRYVDAYNGNDATAVRGEAGLPWLNPYVALAAAVSGDIVYCRNGFFLTGTNPCNVPVGVTFTGEGMNSTWIQGTASLLTNGPIVGLGSTSVVSHMTIDNVAKDYYQTAVLGCFHASTNTQRAFTNAIVHHVRMLGDSDCWYFRHTNTWSLRAWNCIAESKWDSFVSQEEGSGHQGWFKSCTFISDLRTALNPQSRTVATAKAITVDGGTIEFIGCEAIATNADTTIALGVSGGKVRWIGGVLRSAGTNNNSPVTYCKLLQQSETGILEYYGNQAGVDDVLGTIIWGSEQIVVTNISFPGAGIVINSADRSLPSPPVFIGNGINVGAETDPGPGLFISQGVTVAPVAGTATNAFQVLRSNGVPVLTVASNDFVTVASRIRAGTNSIGGIYTPVPSNAMMYVTEAITAHAHYAFLDQSFINYSGVAVQGHASFDAAPMFLGIQNSDHHHSYQDATLWTNSGTLSEYAAFSSAPRISAGTVTKLMGLEYLNASTGWTPGSSTINGQFGVYIHSLTRGGSNYAVWTDGTTPSRFGGAVRIDGQITAAGGAIVVTNGTGIDATGGDPQSTNFFRYVATTNVTALTVNSIPGGWNNLNLRVWGRGTNIASLDTWSFRVNDNANAVYYRHFFAGLVNTTLVGFTTNGTSATLGAGGDTNALPTAPFIGTVDVPEYSNPYWGKQGLGEYSYLQNTNGSPSVIKLINTTWIDVPIPITNLVIFGGFLTGTVFSVTLSK